MNSSSAPLTQLPEIIARILAVSSPEKIILFGSFARGDPDPDSDLDLLVVLEGVEKPRAESVRLLRALRGIPVPVDILVTTPQRLERYRLTSGLVYQSALQEGKVIYERPTAA